MIKKYKDRVLVIKENLKEGKGKVEIKHFLEKKDFKTNIRHCSETIIPTGSSIGMHTHINEEEIYIINKGKGLLIDKNGRSIVEKGDIVLTKDGESHGIQNIGTEDLNITAIIVTH